MLVCPNCKNKQESGKFCESCGQPLEVQETSESSNTDSKQPDSIPNQQPSLVEQPVAGQVQTGSTMEDAQPSNEKAEMVKETLNNYWSYFINLLKNPTTAFSLNENQLINGLITIGLYVILFPLGAYFFLNGMLNNEFFGTGLPFHFNFRVMFLLLIILAIAFFSAFAMIKIGKHQDSFKLLITQFGGLLVPVTLLHIVSLLGGIMKAPSLIIIPLILSLAYTLTYVPVYLVYEKISEVHPRGQKVYFSFAAVLIMSIAFYILGEAMLTNFITDIENMVGGSYFW